MKKKISIEGMMCQNCVKHVTNALQNLEGTINVSVNLDDKYAIINSEKKIDDAIIQESINTAGYEVTLIQNI